MAADPGSIYESLTKVMAAFTVAGHVSLGLTTSRNGKLMHSLWQPSFYATTDTRMSCGPAGPAWPAKHDDD
jgi:hypothetical protein